MYMYIFFKKQFFVWKYLTSPKNKIKNYLVVVYIATKAQ